MVYPPLHLPTLVAVTTVVIAFSGLVLLLACRRDRGSAALAYWGGAMIVGAVGLAALAFTPVLGRVAGLSGSAAILLGTGLSWTGARVFAARRPRPGIVLAGPAAWLLWCLLSPDPGQLRQTSVLFAFGALYTAAAAVELWRGRDEKLRSRNAVIAVLLLHACVYLARAATLALGTDLLLQLSIDAAAVLMFEALLHTVGVAFLLLAIMKERAELQSLIQLRQLALQDGLTGLGNRRLFDFAIEHEVQRAIRSRTPLALLMIDADYFKGFNDTYGHQSGDDCLRAVASAIQSATRRPGDIAVRYGGEEFAVLMAGTDENGALAVAAAIHANVAALRIEHAGSPHGQVAVSIGAAALPPHPANCADKLVRGADCALYDAKAAGRNTTRTAATPAGPALVPLRMPLPSIYTVPATSP